MLQVIYDNIIILYYDTIYLKIIIEKKLMLMVQ